MNSGSNNFSYGKTWSSASSTVYVMRSYIDTDNSDDKPKEPTAEQWLRNRVQEICDAGKLATKGL